MIGGGHRAGLAAALLCSTFGVLRAAPADWPEELGRARRPAAAAPGGPEHRVLTEALALLEPGRQFDAAAARGALGALAAGTSSESATARYALAWLDEQEGQDERAEGGYTRLIVEVPESEAGARARVGLARLLLRRNLPGPAARFLQEAIEAQPALLSQAWPWRELATRAVLRRGTEGPWLRHPTGFRQIAGLVGGPRGGAWIADSKTGRIVEFDSVGVERGTWDLEALEALAGDSTGRVFAAAGGAIYRLDPDGRTTRRASSGAFAPLAALAADGSGRLWVLDRKGRRIGCVSPGREEPETCWESDEARLLDLVWDGRRLIGADGRSRRVVTVGRDDSVHFEADEFRPSALGADGGGGLAVLDARRGIVKFVRADGRPDGELRLPPETAGEVQRIARGPDGTLHAFDARDGSWIHRP